MRLKPKYLWFAGATLLYVVLAAFIFWGTWSLDIVPVMPDCENTLPADNARAIFAKWLSDGLFQPADLMRLIGSAYFWVELNYAVAAYFAMLGMAYFCRGRSLCPLASYGAGILLSLCGYWFSLFSAGHIGWFHWMTYGIFAFGLADRAVQKGRLRHWMLLGATLGWSGFHQPDIWLLFTFFTGIYFLFRTLECTRDAVFWRRWSIGVAIAAAVFALIFAPGALSMLESKDKREAQIAQSGDTASPQAQGENGKSREERWIFVTNWSLPVEETAEFLIPRGQGDTSCPFVLSIGRAMRSGVERYVGALGRPFGAKSGNYRQHSLYMGFVTCALAFIGILSGVFRRQVRRDVVFFAIAAFVFWLLSLGRNFEILYRLVFALPLLDSIRCPVKWVHLAEFSVVALSAYGIEAMLSFLCGAFRNQVVPVAVVALAIAAGAFDLARVHRLYCAPVDVGAARRGNMNSELRIMHRNEFSKPEVRRKVEEKSILPVARYFGHPDFYVVQSLGRYGKIPLSPKPLPVALGIVSMLASLAVAAVAVRKR